MDSCWVHIVVNGPGYAAVALGSAVFRQRWFQSETPQFPGGFLGMTYNFLNVGKIGLAIL
jgi:hypothetical protein